MKIFIIEATKILYFDSPNILNSLFLFFLLFLFLFFYILQVMLIAKSYYGKKLRHGIKRLAEGKYRIAGKIVFVRVSSLLHYYHHDKIKSVKHTMFFCLFQNMLSTLLI